MVTIIILINIAYFASAFWHMVQGDEAIVAIIMALFIILNLAALAAHFGYIVMVAP